MSIRKRHKLVIIRGFPGSGKSTLAEKIAEKTGGAHFEADMFFLDGDEYKFNPSRLHHAHEWCYDSVLESIKSGRRVTIVSNTFIKESELNPYLKLGVEYTLDVVVTEPDNSWSKNHVLCDVKGIHDVPFETMTKMARKWYTLPETRDNILQLTAEEVLHV